MHVVSSVLLCIYMHVLRRVFKKAKQVSHVVRQYYYWKPVHCVHVQKRLAALLVMFTDARVNPPVYIYIPALLLVSQLMVRSKRSMRNTAKQSVNLEIFGFVDGIFVNF